MFIKNKLLFLNKKFDDINNLTQRLQKKLGANYEFKERAIVPIDFWDRPF